MKKVIFGLAPVLLVLGLLLTGCSGTVDGFDTTAPRNTDIADLEIGQLFTWSYKEMTELTVNGVSAPVARFLLFDADGNEAAYAYCADKDKTAVVGKYMLVSAAGYFKNGEDIKIKAALDYIANNFNPAVIGEHPYNQLIQAMLWNIVNGYAINAAFGDDGSIMAVINFIIDNLDKLIGGYGVTMEGPADGLHGPYNVSAHPELSDLDFDLTFDEGFADFVDENGTVITRVKPGKLFYVQAAGDVSGTFTFTASAYSDKEYYYMSDFLLFIDVRDVDSGNAPVYQPLLQPIFSTVDTYLYSCSGSFSVESPCDDHKIPNSGKKPIPPSTKSYSSVTATNAGNAAHILAGLNPKNGNPYYCDRKESDTPFVVPNSNHFVFAKMTKAELNAGVPLEFLTGNKFQVAGAGIVRLANGHIVLSIDNFAKGNFGVIAFAPDKNGNIPAFKNGNIHSQKEADLIKAGATGGFSHNNAVSVKCPATDVIYLYFHAGSLQFRP